MRPLYRCNACGFLSTLGGEFTTIEGVRFDKECAADHALGIDPAATWVQQKLDAPPRVCRGPAEDDKAQSGMGG